MAAFTAYPTTLQGCYQELIFEYSHTIVSNSNPMSIEVDVLINGNSFRTLFLNTYATVTEVSGDYVYTFDIDVSKTVQSFFDNNQFFYDSNKTYPYTDTDLLASVVLDVYRYEPDADGVLTRNATATRSNSRLFFNSLKNDMSDYTDSSNRKFITKREDYRISSQITNLLAFYSDSNANAININRSGSFVSNLSLTNDQLHILNLNDYILSDTTSLELTIGFLTGEDFTQRGERLTFTILDDECNAIGLHFQSELGTSEVFRFRTYEYEIAKDRETELYVSTTDLMRMYSGQIDKNINIERNGFFNEEWNYFSDVVTSSIFYVEENSGTLDEVFSTFNSVPFRTIDGNININLAFSYSEKQKIFRN